MNTRTYTDAVLRASALSSLVASPCMLAGYGLEEPTRGHQGNLDTIQKPAFRW